MSDLRSLARPATWALAGVEADMLACVSKKKPDPSVVGALAGEVRRLRKAAGLTQIQLADQAGVSRGTISNIENAIYEDARGDTLEKIAPLLHTTPQALFGLSQQPAGKTAVSDPPPMVTAVPQRPPGLEKWLTRRAKITEYELHALERYRSRPGDTSKDMESDTFWDRELDYVRDSYRELTAGLAGQSGGAQSGHAAAPERVPSGKSRH